MIDHRIAMMGQPANILGEMARGTQLAGMQNDLMRTAKMQNLFAQQGPGIAQGDPRAMKMLAQMDPMAAFNMGQTRQEGARADARLGIDRERLQMIRDETARALASAEDQAAAAREAAEITRLAQDGERARINGDQARWEQITGMIGYDLPFTDEGVMALRAVAEGASAVEAMRPQPVAPMSTPGKVAADIAAGILPEGTPLQSGPLVDMSGANIGGQSAPQVGSIPQGYQLRQIANADGSVSYAMDPIPGGPADTTNEDAKAADARETSANIVLDEINIARGLIEGQSITSPATGITGAAASRIDSTRAGALKNRLETIKANIGFDKLQAMRDASPTGGALGQVSEFENRLLQAVYGSLVQAQDAQELLYNLNRLEGIYNRIINVGIPEEEARTLYGEIVSGGFAPDNAENSKPTRLRYNPQTGELE